MMDKSYSQIDWSKYNYESKTFLGRTDNYIDRAIESNERQVCENGIQ